MKEKLALYASAAVFCNFWSMLIYLHYSGSLTAVANSIPGLQAMVKFEFVGTTAVIPAVLTFVVVYVIVYFQESDITSTPASA
jgi:hypothetical protein